MTTKTISARWKIGVMAALVLLLALTFAAFQGQAFVSAQETPEVIVIAVTSSPASGDTYRLGEVIEVTVAFNENVVVTGTPQLEIQVGDDARIASYSSSTGATVVFSYTVVDGDIDSDGISIGAGKLSLNGGTIKDAANNDAILEHTALPAQSVHKVDGSETTAPTVSLLAVTSDPGEDEIYTAGDVIEVTVTFSESVVVTGAPQLEIDVGGAAETAAYANTSDAEAIYRYTVVAGDTDSDGISIGADQLSLNGGTIQDGAGNDAVLTHSALATQSGHKVDAAAPTISTLAVTSDSGEEATYSIGDTIDVSVIFSEDVTVTGTPELEIDVGGEVKFALYVSITGMAVTFSYIVEVGDDDSDGISVGSNRLYLNGGTINDAAGNAADLTHDELPAQPFHKVYAPGGL